MDKCANGQMDVWAGGRTDGGVDGACVCVAGRSV